LNQTNLDARDARIAGAIEVATVKLRSEFGDAGGKLHDELRDELRNELDRLHVMDQERQERERELSQTNLDARHGRIAGDIEAATVKLRNEIDVATDKLRDELRDALDSLPVVDQERRELERALSQTNLDASNARIDARIDGAIETAIARLRSEFDIEELRKEFRIGLGRLPIVKDFLPQTVHYAGDERALRIEPDDVCTIISATTIDNQTTIYAIGRRRQRGHRVTTNRR
jgi:hypothetical protein